MSESRSDSPTKCGLCGCKAYQPERFQGEWECDGLFNVCGDCGAECSGTDVYSVKDRWFWTGAKIVAKQRDAIEAMELDAERHAARFDD